MSESNGTSLPERIGEYTPTEKIGEGGFGVVYAATAPDGTEVAIKVLRPELSNNTEVRERLRREATASQAITSDRVARLLGHDTEADRPYIVMERIQGATLTDYVGERGPLAGAMLTSVAVAIAEALRDIHTSGILHRDLKPSNVMLGPDGIKILDFGIAAINEAADFTQTGAVLGSASWMSPEQITGTSVDASSDIFAMGLVLAFAALGRHPYGEGRPEALMYRIDQGQPDLDAITGPPRRLIEAMLRRDPKERPTVANVIDVLSGSNSNSDLLSPTPPAEPNTPTPQVDATRVIPSYPSPKQPEPVKSSRKGKKIALALLTLGVLGGGGLGAAILLSASGETPSQLATDSSTTTVTSTTTPPTTTEKVVEVATTTTEAEVRVARTTTTSTTVPLVPVYKLYEFEGRTFRWNPCQNPISIYLNNSDGSLKNSEIAAIARFLSDQAYELSRITDHSVVYRGLTDERTSDTYKFGEKILIQISDGGDGLLRDQEYSGTAMRSYDRASGGTWEVDSVQIHILSDMFLADSYQTLSTKSKHVLMYYLGQAFGLGDLTRSDFLGFGVTKSAQMLGERMNWDTVSDLSGAPNDGEWGLGDELGMYIAQMGSCF
ncbi:MAG: serine/threonine-protein kinase [Actinomycetota bacterium]|nr:serine/threonine-protein kinase [Actinomycetota bacterium]